MRPAARCQRSHTWHWACPKRVAILRGFGKRVKYLVEGARTDFSFLLDL